MTGNLRGTSMSDLMKRLPYVSGEENSYPRLCTEKLAEKLRMSKSHPAVRQREACKLTRSACQKMAGGGVFLGWRNSNLCTRLTRLVPRGASIPARTTIILGRRALGDLRIELHRNADASDKENV